MRIVFCGSPEFAVPSLERLLSSEHEIVAVVTQPDRPAGRGLKLKPPPVKEVAARHGIEILQPEKFNVPPVLERLEGLEPDLIVVVAYGKIFRRRSLNIPRKGCVNLHASLLPRYRGIAPVNWAIINGETKTGVTTIFMDEGIDTGDMILWRETSIGENETAGELLERLAHLGAEVLAETCDLISRGEAKRHKQDEALATYAPKLKKEDGLVSWGQPSRRVHNLIRGVTPWPGAVARIGARPVKVLKTSLGPSSSGNPGEIIAIDSSKGILVACAEGSVWLSQLQAPGKRPLSGAEFARGYRLKIGDRMDDGAANA